MMAGFREHAHTADWELEAWAEDLPGLFEQSARGMYALSCTRLQTGPREQRNVSFRAFDIEGLLVHFLDELLYFAQQSGLGFDCFDLVFHPAETGELMELQATLDGAPILSVDKEIKAVTYHNLVVRQEENEVRVRIVFDV